VRSRTRPFGPDSGCTIRYEEAEQGQQPSHEVNIGASIRFRTGYEPSRLNIVLRNYS
jgi:hypothetical protein